MSEFQYKLEVCVESVESALTAQSAGAYRVEFCNALSEGGITPSYAQIEKARELLTLKLYVIIRPRGGDFLFSQTEFDIMKTDIHACGRIGCDGVVIGMLNADGTVDKKRNRELVEIAESYGMGVTFHRAFDRANNLFQALEDVIVIGCERILTSGGQATAEQGLSEIKALVDKAAGRIAIMPGSGVNPQNIAKILSISGAGEIHGTFRKPYSSLMLWQNPAFKTDNDHLYITDIDQLKQIQYLFQSDK